MLLQRDFVLGPDERWLTVDEMLDPNGTYAADEQDIFNKINRQITGGLQHAPIDAVSLDD